MKIYGVDLHNKKFNLIYKGTYLLPNQTKIFIKFTLTETRCRHAFFVDLSYILLLQKLSSSSWVLFYPIYL